MTINGACMLSNNHNQTHNTPYRVSKLICTRSRGVARILEKGVLTEVVQGRCFAPVY